MAPPTTPLSGVVRDVSQAISYFRGTPQNIRAQNIHNIQNIPNVRAWAVRDNSAFSGGIDTPTPDFLVVEQGEHVTLGGENDGPDVAATQSAACSGVYQEGEASRKTSRQNRLEASDESHPRPQTFIIVAPSSFPPLVHVAFVLLLLTWTVVGLGVLRQLQVQQQQPIPVLSPRQQCLECPECPDMRGRRLVDAWSLVRSLFPFSSRPPSPATMS
jgi:hypothetical protein